MFQHYQQRVDGDTVRRRSPSFSDHSSQATLFWNNMSDLERRHIVQAFYFELGRSRRPRCASAWSATSRTSTPTWRHGSPRGWAWSREALAAHRFAGRGIYDAENG